VTIGGNGRVVGAKDTRLLDLQVVQELRAYVAQAPENGTLLLTGSSRARAIISDAAPADKALRNALVCLLDPDLRAGHTLQSATATARSLKVLSSRLELSQGISGSIAERAVQVMAAVFGTAQPTEAAPQPVDGVASDETEQRQPVQSADPPADAGFGPPSDQIEQPDRRRPPQRRGAVFRNRVWGLAALGAGLVTGSFTVLDWFRHSGAEDLGSWKFGQVHGLLDRLNGFDSVSIASKLYFSWLGWVLLAGAVAAMVVAHLSTRVAKAFRLVGPAMAVVGIVMTFVALRVLNSGDPRYTEYITHADLGFWCAVAGFAIIGVTAAMGEPATARKSRSRQAAVKLDPSSQGARL
jgi:hypothetical protein